MPTDTAATRERYLSLAAAISCTSVAGVAIGFTSPLLALILKHQGLSNSMIGASSATQSLAIFLAAPMAPRLIVGCGFVPTILSCVAITLVTLLLLPLFPNVYAWLPIRLALGAGSFALFIACETWVNQIASEQSRGRVMGLFGFLWGAGLSAGPMIIGITGIDGWPPFLVAAALVAAAAVPMSLVPRLAPVIQARSRRRPWHLLRLAPAAMISSLVLGVAGYTLDSFLPIYGLSHGLRASLAVGLLTTLLVGEAVVQYPAGWLADRMDRRRLLFGAICVGAAAFLGVTAIAQLASPVLLFPMVAIIGIAMGTIWTVATVLLGQSFQGGDLVAAYSVSGMLHGIGMVAGPLSIGAAVDRWGVEAIPVGIALCCLLCLPVGFSEGRLDGLKGPQRP